MRVGIIGAMQNEVTKLLECMSIRTVDRVSVTDYYVGTLDDREVVIAKSGPGKVNAAICAQTMILKYAPDVILNTGVAGSLSHALAVGDTAVASAVVQYDVDTTAVGDPIGLISGINVVEFPSDAAVVERLTRALDAIPDVPYQVGMVATGDKFLKSKGEKDEILKHFTAIACDMESGSIGQVCYVNQTAFGIIRTISDNADSTSHIDYAQFLELAASRSAAVARLFLHQGAL
ncbi:MAG: 5'-methylthioadenosine/adenosylhomocysteine nucleosidase [Firmicutes bacterium]|nr:5'-methylthioadenosine/adenosylhomocysteine nucleosidase [Bacillota bacterium]